MAIAGWELPQDGKGRGRGNAGGNGNGRGNGKPACGDVPASQGVGKMTLVEAAQLVERLQGRAAHERELEALRIARDALLVVVSEGFETLGERLRSDARPAHDVVRDPLREPVPEPSRARAASGSSTASFRAASAPPR